jgi:predicted O-methyltransferase YrrM
VNRREVKIDAPKARMPRFPPRYFNPSELDILVYLIASVRPRTVVEFGCHEGRAAATVLNNVPSIEHYVGIDVLPGYVTLKECQRKEVPGEPGKLVRDDPRFRLILRKRGSFDLSAQELPACDAVFTDADHSRAGVLNDTALALALLRPGGVLIWHDDNRLPQVEVSETLDELAQQGTDIVHVADTWLAFLRVPA